MRPLVIRNIVENNLCIGCGICAASCPSNVLGIEWNYYGEYIPFESKPCEKECGLCLKVCPFADNNDNEDDIGKTLFGHVPQICHLSETGYYLDSYVGYARDTREHGSSGGMATWLLSTLLKKGIVDYIIAVIPNADPNKLFKYSILEDQNSVLSSAGSAYYPVELSNVLRKIQNNPGRCAIIGLPCFIKGIRLAQQRNFYLKDRIVVCVGLICGQMKSSNFTSYVTQLAGVNGSLKKILYRGKDPEQPASNFYFFFQNDIGNTKKLYWKEGISEAWINRWFTPFACNYCDDIFAECADVAFMDAWLPEYQIDSKGTNIVLVRSKKILKVLEDGIVSHEVHLIPIRIEKVTQSQKGVISIKRQNLAYQLYIGKQQGLKLPKKRVAPLKLANPFLRRVILMKNKMLVISRNTWSNNQDSLYLKLEMQPYLAQITRLNKLSQIIILPHRFFRMHVVGSLEIIKRFFKYGEK